MGCPASLRPQCSPLNCFLNSLCIIPGLRHIIEAHCNIASKPVLDFNCSFRSEHHFFSCKWIPEQNPFPGKFQPESLAQNLEASRISKAGIFPFHEFVQPSMLLNDLKPGLQ